MPGEAYENAPRPANRAESSQPAMNPVRPADRQAGGRMGNSLLNKARGPGQTAAQIGRVWTLGNSDSRVIPGWNGQKWAGNWAKGLIFLVFFLPCVCLTLGKYPYSPARVCY
jgi:hypothetical protein